MAIQLLLIEDEAPLRENVAELLTLSGYQVETASDGREGAMMAMLHQPDLILCDVMMPRLDGYQVLELVRANRLLATVPFIFLTAKAENTDLRRGMNLGADDYLTKPFSLDELLGAISSRLDQEKRRALAVETQLQNHLRQLSIVSAHEYNTPLAGIIGFADLLKDPFESFSKVDVQSTMAMIIACCQRLKRNLDNSHLANRLLTRVEPLPPPQTRTATISEVGVSQMLRTGCQRYGQHATHRVEVETASLKLSQDHLSKILEELLDNALKFSPPTSPLRIMGWQTGGQYQLSITDQGRGISAEDIAKLGPYTQFDRSFYEQQGNGLGLFIVNELTKLNRGHFSLSSQVGGPTTASVELPIVP